MRGKDLTGKTFGRLRAERRGTTSESGSTKWVCLCECGNKTEVTTKNLTKGRTKSCGCLHNELLSLRSRTHGKSKTKEYEIWNQMIRRCENGSNKRYESYGGRGIKVCERWHNFNNFHEDMGNKPDEYSLDRIDNNGDYEPGNCRWATNSEQRRNQKINNKYGANGVYKHPDIDKFCARIHTKKGDVHLGSFDNVEDAVKARKEAEVKYWT